MTSPFMIAVSGGSGSGKTTFVRKLWNRLEVERPLVISIDHYYSDLGHLPLAERAKQNFDDPAAIERDLLHEQISLLRNGVAVERPCYDFASHSRLAQTERQVPSSIIIVDGIFSLCYPELLKLFDLKIFLEVEDDVRVVRRIGRDIAERGRSFDNCAGQYLGSVKAMYQKHIQPSKTHADFIIPWHSFNERALVLLGNLIQLEVQNKQKLSARSELL